MKSTTLILVNMEIVSTVLCQASKIHGVNHRYQYTESSAGIVENNLSSFRELSETYLDGSR